MNDMKEEKLFITINEESYITSLAKDVTSLGILAFFCWFNHNYIGGSYFVNFLILCMIFLFVVKTMKLGGTHTSFYSVKKTKIEEIRNILKND